MKIYPRPLHKSLLIWSNRNIYHDNTNINHRVRNIYHDSKNIRHRIRKIYHDNTNINHRIRNSYHDNTNINHSIRNIYHNTTYEYQNIFVLHLMLLLVLLSSGWKTKISSLMLIYWKYTFFIFADCRLKTEFCELQCYCSCVYLI